MSVSNVIPLYLIPRGAAPRRLGCAARLEEVDDKRMLACPRYSNCLNFAARRNWAGFHCSNCPFFQEHQAALADAVNSR